MSLGDEGKTNFSNNVKSMPKLPHLPRFADGLFAKDGKDIVGALVAAEWCTLTKIAVICCEGLLTEDQQRALGYHSMYVGLLGKPSITKQGKHISITIIIYICLSPENVSIPRYMIRYRIYQ